MLLRWDLLAMHHVINSKLGTADEMDNDIIKINSLFIFDAFRRKSLVILNIC